MAAATSLTTPVPPNESSVQTIEESKDIAILEASMSNSSHVFLESQPAEKLRVLLEILGNLSKTLELDRLLPKIVDSLFQLFKQADRCFIIMRDEVTERGKTIERLIPKVIKTRRPQDESSTT